MQERKKVVENLYMRLREDIVSGRFKPGEHLAEKLLTEEYAVSRASIREVTRQLGSLGFLTIEPNRGAVVTKLSWQDINVCYNIIIRCESYAAALFAEHGESDVLKELKSLHRRMQTKAVRSKYRDWLKANDEFHELIYKNCGYDILTNIIHYTRLRINTFRFQKTQQVNMGLYLEEHERILAAISERNPAEAEKLMIKHLESAKRNRFVSLSEYTGLFGDLA